MRINGTATHDLTHDRIKGQPVGVVDVLVSSQPPEHRLPEQAVKTMDGVLATAAVIQRTRCKIRQPEHVIQLAHHQKTAVGTELRATKLQLHPAVKTKPPTTRFACTLWVIHNPPPSSQLTCRNIHVSGNRRCENDKLGSIATKVRNAT